MTNKKPEGIIRPKAPPCPPKPYQPVIKILAQALVPVQT